ncbi:MAG TPA: DUF2271 domain-containing protein [Opitutaceae bacterium]|nr:DUF2271 domain-containing protein [Opitutaceae bacterium]
MNHKLALLLPTLAAPVLSAGDLRVTIEIPRLNVAEYHRPYVAAWIATPDQSVATQLTVWYDVDMKNDEGTTWLKDLRQWWRRAGRTLTLPIDGVTGPTRAAGEHALVFKADSAPLAKLTPGDYQLVVEAAREVGGREIVTIPFTWTGDARLRLEAKGETELGRVSLETVPQ